MFEDSPVWGWGAGSFEYIFPVFQQAYPEIHKRGTTRMIWEYAHNDPLQTLAEYGIVGFTLFALLFLAWLVGMIRTGAYRKPIPVWCGLAALATLAHSNVDFVFHNPAILVTVAAFLAISYRYGVLDRDRRRHRIVLGIRGEPPKGIARPSEEAG
jgi:O-antigen ligase